MNLYRNFGCMLESWVADGFPEGSCYSEEPLEKQQDANSSDSASADSIRLPGTTLRSESEDSGVDLSSLGSTEASRSSVLTSVDSLTFKPAAICEIEEDIKPSCSSPDPSLCSSSSPCFSEASTGADRPSVDQALRGNELDWTQATGRESPFLEEGLDVGPRRRCNTTSLIRGLHAVPAGPPHRTESMGSGRPHGQPADQHRQAQTLQQLDLNDKDLAEAVCHKEPDWDGLSPGLLYLEQMCRMLEEIARLQQQNKSLQLEMNSIRGQRKTTSSQNCEISTRAHERPEVLRFEESSLSSQPFRRRTASDTWAFLRPRRKAKTQAEKFMSTDILAEEPDGNLHMPMEAQQKKAGTSLKQRISSQRKNEKLEHSRNGSLHGDKSLLKLFRNRRKTTLL
ncbi:uncharacterized protein si:dkey-106l3.7 [Pygocentrus nattereri]|uniref:uncharacterized protein si:dkey-106l3.7 n=1 Tax=Pygocentrus nattereri TaxID=42514 RepID=UPI00081465B9|nr:uncharacterized protein si:dkey-106l3.7 [Pygocentrus nattereri]